MFIRIHENTGGAGGFHEGMKRTYEKGHDWFWLMDDDAEPKEDCLFELFKIDNFVVAPLIINKDEEIQNYHHKLINGILLFEKPAIPYSHLSQLPVQLNVVSLDANAFVGPLIHRLVIKKVGFPNKDLFIWGDDTEYTYRIKKYGIELKLNTKAHIYHKDRPSLVYSSNNFLKIYYGTRNRIYIARKYGSFLSLIYWITRISLSIIKVLGHKNYLKIYKIKIKALINGLFFK